MQNPTELIKKLLRLAQSANENEAGLAAERAAELALKYGIDLSSLNTSDNPHRIDPLDHEASQWISNIVAGVCLVNACSYWRTHDDSAYRVAGRPHAIEATRLISLYLINAVKRLNREAVSSYNFTQQQRADYRKAFRLAASQRLYARLKAKHEALQNPSQNTANALVVQSYYKNELAIIETILPSNLRTIKSRGITIRSNQGKQDGAAAGDSISLNDQLTTHQPLAITGG